MKAVRRQKATGMFSWIGSDGWGGRGLAYLGKEEQVMSLICISIISVSIFIAKLCLKHIYNSTVRFGCGTVQFGYGLGTIRYGMVRYEYGTILVQ